MSKPEADILTPDPTMNQYAVSLPTAAWNTFLRQRNKIFRGNLQISLLLPEFPRHVAGGASQWKTAASCHCCKVTLGLFMASAERRPGSGAYIHPAAEEDFCPAKTQFQLIEGENVWKPKLNKVVLPPPLLTFHLWLGKLSKSSGWRNFSGSHLHSRETVGENQGVKEEEVEGGRRRWRGRKGARGILSLDHPPCCLCICHWEEMT